MVAGITSSTSSTEQTLGFEPAAQVSSQDFLRLLTVQLRYQNPLEPMKETEFVSQLAQFSQLEAQRDTSALMRQLLQLQTLQEAAGLLGRTVVLKPLDGGAPVQGTVERVKLVEGDVRLVVGGRDYSLYELVEVA
ncbi:MAG: hypothetical protein GX496_09495 [Firmicutes bacterium]|uniref:Flagellar hook capping FlgD N-terminal domain-containing protein n=1 Tax=Geochorda subterranea TaxID=3109564 RepID=A0ABZ1BKV3_9FIRM|nr:flagellar hook capping FlgD N-terminal domain-containing protein [Limnochorda sp. LNt]NLG69776.1 hypothetical protein [Bacillota bacterium]WRP13334.1 flagellar hook capping FlgD N-terminal domain-containing protein [Limnochorda sp. LNt]